jgi:two-component system cell cycle response regulator DivK
MAGESLLVVDENLVHSRLVAVLLESAGYHVQTASDSEQALEKIKTNRPRLVIMDIRVPLQGGLVLVKRIKADPLIAKTRILMITPSIQTGEERTVLEAGCDAYLSKPVDTRHLPTIIAELLSKENP